jgi:NADP-dependent 3-hydroxy acid dehydrogenase YdfG
MCLVIHMIGSITRRKGSPGAGIYCATTAAAVKTFTDALRQELIDVNRGEVDTVR